MWTAFFEALSQGFQFFRSLVKKEPIEVEPTTQRAQTVAGAASNLASHNPPKKKQ